MHEISPNVTESAKRYITIIPVGIGLHIGGLIHYQAVIIVTKNQ